MRDVLFSMIHSLTHSSHTFAFDQLRFPLNIKRQRKGLLRMEHCLFNKRFPKKVKCFWSTWTLLCNISIWYIWIERKDPCFNNCKLDRCIWEGQVDYGRIEWANHPVLNKPSSRNLMKLCAHIMLFVLEITIKFGGLTTCLINLTSISCDHYLAPRIAIPYGLFL
jgi:hypothetical protein